jgi:hypothetical protein
MQHAVNKDLLTSWRGDREGHHHRQVPSKQPTNLTAPKTAAQPLIHQAPISQNSSPPHFIQPLQSLSMGMHFVHIFHL